MARTALRLAPMALSLPRRIATGASALAALTGALAATLLLSPPASAQDQADGPRYTPLRVSAAPLLLRYREARPLDPVPLMGRYFRGLSDLALQMHCDPSCLDFEEEYGDGEVRWPLSSDRLTELVRSTVQPQVWDEDGVSLGCNRDELVVLAPRVTQGAVDRLVQGLINTIAPTVEVEVAVLRDPRADAGVERRSLTAARERLSEVAKRPGDLLFHGRMRARPGERIQLGRLRKDMLQYRCEGEVAAKAGTIQKQRAPITVGLGVDLELQLLPDSRRMAVFGTFADRDLELSEKPTPLVGYEIDSYEPATLDEHVVTFASVLPGNGAVELPLGNGLRILVGIEKQASRAGELGTVEVWPHGFLTRRLQVDVLGPEVDEDLSTSFGTTPLDPDALQELIVHAVPALEEVVDASIEADSRHLYMRAPPELTQQAEAVLEGLVAARSRAFQVTIGREQRLPERGATWQPVGAPLVLATLARRTARVVSGTSTSYVDSAEVMIAEDSSLRVPRLKACFAGVCGQLAVLPEDKECDLAIDLGWYELHGWRDVDSRQNGAYETRVPLIERRTVSHLLHLRLGEKLALGTGPRIRKAGGEMAETRFWIQVEELGKD
ncbi:MAG: hypothetical protein R3F30_00550 [Planctomycetota bacterium]